MGRQQFSTAGSRGEDAGTLAVNNRPDIEFIKLDRSADVASGATETIELYAPTGSTYEVIGLSVSINAPGGTTGSHGLEVFNTSKNIRRLLGESTYDTKLQWDYGGWEISNSRKQPQNRESQTTMMESLTATESSPIVWEYRNGSDVTQTHTRFVRFLTAEVSY